MTKEQGNIAPVINIQEWLTSREKVELDPRILARRQGYREFSPPQFKAVKRVLEFFNGGEEPTLAFGYKMINGNNSKIQFALTEEEILLFKFDLSKSQYDVLTSQAHNLRKKQQSEILSTALPLHLAIVAGRIALLSRGLVISDPERISKPKIDDHEYEFTGKNWRSVTTWRAAAGLAIAAVSESTRQERHVKEYLNEVALAHYSYEQLMEASEEKEVFTTTQVRSKSEINNFTVGVTCPLSYQEIASIVDMTDIQD